MGSGLQEVFAITLQGAIRCWALFPLMFNSGLRKILIIKRLSLIFINKKTIQSWKLKFRNVQEKKWKIKEVLSYFTLRS